MKRKPKFTFVPATDDSVSLSLKGLALLDAIEAGLVREKADGSGYDISAFLRFWDAFSGWIPKDALIPERPDEIQKLTEMLNQQGNESACGGANQR